MLLLVTLWSSFLLKSLEKLIPPLMALPSPIEIVSDGCGCSTTNSPPQTGHRLNSSGQVLLHLLQSFIFNYYFVKLCPHCLQKIASGDFSVPQTGQYRCAFASSFISFCKLHFLISKSSHNCCNINFFFSKSAVS